MSCGVGCKSYLDPALLWLWHRLVAVVPFGPLAWEPPYAMGIALKRLKKKKKDTHTQIPLGNHSPVGLEKTLKAPYTEQPLLQHKVM